MGYELYRDCTVDCERRVECVVCHKIKGPIGRSVAMEMANGYCDHECEGYHQPPKPGHLWPGELAEIRADELASGEKL